MYFSFNSNCYIIFFFNFNKQICSFLLAINLNFSRDEGFKSISEAIGAANKSFTSQSNLKPDIEGNENNNKNGDLSE